MPKQVKINAKKAVSMYNNNVSIADIAKKYAVSYTAVRNLLIREGVVLRKQGVIKIDLPEDLGEGSLRKLAKEHGVSYQTIANRKKERENG